MLPLEHSSLLLTCIKQYLVLKTYFQSFREWPFYTHSTVINNGVPCLSASAIIHVIVVAWFVLFVLVTLKNILIWLCIFLSGSVQPDPRTAFPYMGGESTGLERLKHFLWDTDKVSTYKETRNQMIGADYSTKFSAWYGFFLHTW